jgi:hypothetical protein
MLRFLIVKIRAQLGLFWKTHSHYKAWIVYHGFIKCGSSRKDQTVFEMKVGLMDAAKVYLKVDGKGRVLRRLI